MQYVSRFRFVRWGGCVCVPHVPARCRGACWFTTSLRGFPLPSSSSPCWGGACVFLTSLRGAGVRVGSPRPPMVLSYPPPPLLHVGGVRVCSSRPCAVQGCVLVHHVPPCFFLPSSSSSGSLTSLRGAGVRVGSPRPPMVSLPSSSSSPCWGGACVFLTSLRGAGVRVGSPRPPMVSSYPPPLLRVWGGCVCVPHVPARCRGACWFTTSPHGFFLPSSPLIVVTLYVGASRGYEICGHPASFSKLLALMQLRARCSGSRKQALGMQWKGLLNNLVAGVP